MPDFREEVRRRLARLNLDPTREASIVEEVALHMEDRYRDLLAQGNGAEQAQATVLAELDQDNRLTRGLREIEPQARVNTEPPGVPGMGSFAASLWKDAPTVFAHCA
jgi:hypothetical protein